MDAQAAWAIASFIVGVLVGVLATIAAFRASVAVLGSESKRLAERITAVEATLAADAKERAAEHERNARRIAESVEPIRRGLANIMLKLGNVHRWEDARDIIGAADLDRLDPRREG